MNHPPVCTWRPGCGSRWFALKVPFYEEFPIRMMKQDGTRLMVRFLLVAAAVVLCVLITFVIRSMFVADRVRHQPSTCSNNLRQIEGGKDQYALDHAGLPPQSMDDLVGTYIRVTPSCPEGGAYSLNALSEDPTCSKAKPGEKYGSKSHVLR